MPYNASIQQNPGSFTPLNQFNDNKEAEKARLGADVPQMIAERVISGNIRALIAENKLQPNQRLGDVANVALTKNGFEIGFDSEELAQPFLQRLKANNISAVIGPGDYGSKITINPNDVPKFLQGLLKMSDAQMENLYNVTQPKVALPPQSVQNQAAPPRKLPEPPTKAPTPPRKLPPTPVAQNVQGGFMPLKQEDWRVDSRLGATHDLMPNIQDLIAKQMQPFKPFDFIDSNLNKEGKLHLKFLDENLAKAFFAKLAKNGINAQLVMNPVTKTRDQTTLLNYEIKIEANDAQKFLTGILQMPRERLENLYANAMRPPQTRTPQENLEAMLFALNPNSPPITPQATTAGPRPNTMTATNLTINELYSMLERNAQNLGIKVKPGNIVDNRFVPTKPAQPFTAAEIILGTKQDSPSCIVKEVPGGVDYTLGPNTSPTQRAAAIEKICQIAVNAAKPGMIYAFPANADEKATFQALDKSLKERFGAGYPDNPDPQKLQKANLTIEQMPLINGYSDLAIKYPPESPRETSNQRLN